MDTVYVIVAIPLVYLVLVRLPMAFLYKLMPDGRLKPFLFRVRWE